MIASLSHIPQNYHYLYGNIKVNAAKIGKPGVPGVRSTGWIDHMRRCYVLLSPTQAYPPSPQSTWLPSYMCNQHNSAPARSYPLQSFRVVPSVCSVAGGKTSLWSACYFGHTDVVGLLLAVEGIDVNLARRHDPGEGPKGDTPLYM